MFLKVFLSKFLCKQIVGDVWSTNIVEYMDLRAKISKQIGNVEKKCYASQKRHFRERLELGHVIIKV